MTDTDLNRFLRDIAEEEAYAEDENEGESKSAGERKGDRPAFRVVQPGTDRQGKPALTEVGAMWKNTSKGGQEYYTLKIGNLRLLVFTNK